MTSSVLSQNELKERKLSTLFNDKTMREPAKHLPEEFITAFKNRSVDPLRTNKCKQKLALLFEKGWKAPMACNETITMHHDVLWAIFPGLPSDLRGTLYLASKEELVATGLGSSLKKCLTGTGGGCQVYALVHIKLFLGKLPAFLNENGRKTASCPVERVQVKFTNNYFPGNLQWTESYLKKRL